jgi:four helix bundle protein
VAREQQQAKEDTLLEGVRKIKAWQLADRLAIQVYRVTKGFPREEIYGLTSQMRRCAVSVPANIVEGSLRQYLKEYAQFLLVALASLGALEYYIHLAKELGCLSDEQHKTLDGLREETGKTLYGLIAWVEKQLAKGKKTKSDLKDAA